MMSQLVAKLPDGSIIEFDKGKFDEWCVYLKRPNQLRYAPKDLEYFSILKKLGSIYGNDKIYNDFVKFYNLTSCKIDNAIINIIIEISQFYNQYKIEICIWFTVIYAGMIAEENKTKAILKKRIKRLGLHQLLIDDFESEKAANYSRGKNWQELDKICKEKGF
jgi:hypothetical protein